MADTLIPERLVNFKVYTGPKSNELIGISDVELPRFEMMTEAISGAGIAGELESVVLGHVKSTVVKLKFLTPNAEAIKLLVPVNQQFDLRGAVQVQDPKSGAMTTKPLRITCRGQAKGFGLGKFEPGKRMDSDVDIECAALTVSYDGVSLVEIDKFNMIYKINGVDYLQSSRRDMGGI